MLENKWKFFLGIVLDLAGMELTFPTASHIVLCSALVARTALISQQ